MKALHDLAVAVGVKMKIMSRRAAAAPDIRTSQHMTLHCNNCCMQHKKYRTVSIRKTGPVERRCGAAIPKHKG